MKTLEGTGEIESRHLWTHQSFSEKTSIYILGTRALQTWHFRVTIFCLVLITDWASHCFLPLLRPVPTHTSYSSFFFTTPQFEAKKFYTWKFANVQQKWFRDQTVCKIVQCMKSSYSAFQLIGKFYTWPNFVTQPVVVMVVTNIRCDKGSMFGKYVLASRLCMYVSY